MSEKPKIVIGEPHIQNHGALIVPVKFDFGWEGTINFPSNITEEEVMRQIKQAYKDMQPKPETKALAQRLAGRTIHV